MQLQTEAIRNIKFDKVTVWDGGNGGNGSSTANFMSNLIKSLPPLHDVAQMAGVELPDYLGEITDKVRTNGKSVELPPKPEPSEPSSDPEVV